MEDKRMQAQNIILEDRERLSISSVLDVEEFCEDKITLETSLGYLEVCGADLKMNKLSVETGELTIEGEINSIIYTDESSKQKGSLLSKLFR
ncbi:MAG: sporulation protein YabP [Clostridia bacterium]|nr:sporulation protein YabP [Clostridia bacterium]